MFLLNPPAPKCVQPLDPNRHLCDLCPCSPKYWRLDVDAFGGHPASWTILEHAKTGHPIPAYDPTINTSLCIWRPRTDSKSAGDFFDDTGSSWFLRSGGETFSTATWNLWVEFPPTERAYRYLRFEPLGANAVEAEDGDDFNHWKCLRPKRMYFHGDLEAGGAEPDEDAQAYGLPRSVLLTPYWP